MEKRLTRIAWGATSGLLYLHFEGYWHMTWVHVPQSDIPDEAEFDYPRPEKYKWRIEDLPGIAPFIANETQVIRGPKIPASPSPPAIVNPITIDMLGYYAVWTPSNSVPPYRLEVTQPFGEATQIWVIDLAQWQLVYAGTITARGSPIMTRDQAIAHFQSDPTLDPSKVGVIIAQVYDENGNHDPPMPPSQEGWTFWNNAAAESGWSGHLETTPAPAPRRGELDGANIIVNLAQLLSSMTPEQRSAGEFKFKIIPEPDSGVKQEIRMYWITRPPTEPGQLPEPLRTDYPVEPAERLYRPTWTDGEEDWDVTILSQKQVTDRWYADDYLEVTVKLRPLEVSYRVVIVDDGGGSGEG